MKRHGTTELPEMKASKLRIPKHEATWLAGIIDGEGWVGLNRAKRRYGYAYWAAVGVGNTDKRLIDELIRITRIGKANISKRPKPAKNVYLWNVNRQLDVANILLTVRGHLILKREQADLILSLPPPNARANAERERIHAELKRLNAKGRH
jgi:hypothetical protein